MNKFSSVLLLNALHEDLTNDITTDEVREFRKEVLKKTILKKFIGPDRSEQKRLHTEAIQNFLDRNEAMQTSFTIPNHRLELATAWSYRLYDIFNSGEFQSNVLTLDACLNAGYAGPGASRGTKHTNFLDKMFNSQLTYTRSSLHQHYVANLSERWRVAEELRDSQHSTKEVNGSVLSSVPKDSGKNRTICTEPSLNMFYQLGAKEVINKLLIRQFNIDVSKQPEINKILACSGSISGELATLDLKDASDSIHYDLCYQILPTGAFNTLNRIRSDYVELPEEVGVFQPYGLRTANMMSTMGNGFTFSLMTLLLASLLDVFLKQYGDKFTPYRDAIFGDDIILPSKYALEFMSVLSDFGFIVNTSKSFTDGPFRESCGGDFYKGHEVRGVYVKGANNAAQIYSAFNRLHWWSVRHGISLLRTLQYLKGLVDFQPVPLSAAGHEGFKIPERHLTARKYDKWGGIYYRYLKPIIKSRRVGDRERNPHGALIAALGGYVRNQRISLRGDILDEDEKLSKLRFKVARNSTSSWDWLPTPYFTSRELGLAWDMLLSMP